MPDHGFVAASRSGPRPFAGLVVKGAARSSGNTGGAVVAREGGCSVRAAPSSMRAHEWRRSRARALALPAAPFARSRLRAMAGQSLPGRVSRFGVIASADWRMPISALQPCADRSSRRPYSIYPSRLDDSPDRASHIPLKGSKGLTRLPGCRHAPGGGLARTHRFGAKRATLMKGRWRLGAEVLARRACT